MYINVSFVINIILDIIHKKIDYELKKYLLLSENYMGIEILIIILILATIQKW